MAIRKTTHILKNTQTTNKALPTSGILMGEPLVNLFNGILFFSGVTNGNYTPFVDPSNATSGGTYFEVGSNVYNLQIRNQITSYNGKSGSQLVGKYLKGTLTGFVLDDITNIGSITGFTYEPSTNVITILQSNGSNLSQTLSAFTSVNLYGSNTVNGSLTVTGNTSLQGVSATNINATNVYASSTLSGVTGNITTLNSNTVNTNNINSTGTGIFNNLTVTGTTSLQNTSATNINATNVYSSNSTTANTATINTLTINTLGTYNTVATGASPSEIVNFSSLTGYVETNDTYVTGGTVITAATNSSKTVTVGLNYKRPDGNNYTLTTENTFVTGGTYNNGTISFSYNDSAKTGFQVTGITSTDTFVTGFTYTPASNSLVISRNQGKDDLTQYINAFSGLSITDLTPGQVVYAGTGGRLKTDTTGQFAYDETSNTLTIGISTGGADAGKLVVNNDAAKGASTFGRGGVIIGDGGSFGPSGTTAGYGDLIVHGNFIVFGTGTTIATNELYVEDPQITLNYNPTGGTYITSLGSGIRIQEGSGTNVDTYFTIAKLNTLTGLTSTQVPLTGEYLNNGVGNSDRGWLTQLNDIVIRNNNFDNGAPNGVRLLAEFDTLDGGVY